MRSKLLLLGSVLTMAVSIMAGSAMASTATVSPGGATTGTSGAVQWGLNTARKTLNCTTAGFTATLTSGSGTLPLAVATDMTWMFGAGFHRGSCIQTGGAGFTFTCSATTTLSATGATIAGVTPMQIRNFSCLEALAGGSCSVRIIGGLVGSYDSASSRLTVSSRGQTLVAVGSSIGSGGTCVWLPNDTSVSLTDSTGASLGFTITPATTISVT
jgi:hypothetical protein